MLRLRYCLLLMCAAFVSAAQQIKKNLKEIVYAQVGERKLLLDLYVPSGSENPLLVVWIHGGAWHSGSKEAPPESFVESGFALASVDYRLSIEAPFPAPIYDIKSAIRFLRANANQYGYRSDNIIIAGSSAGGHLAALVGLSNNDPDLEGTVGSFTKTSSSIQAVIDYYGPTNLTTILRQSTPHGVAVRGPAIALLLGHTLDNVEEIARKASPVFQVDASDPPLLIFHGDQDIQVPINQSHELVGAYEQFNLKVQLEVVYGAGHTNSPYFESKYQTIANKFLKEAFKK